MNIMKLRAASLIETRTIVWVDDLNRVASSVEWSRYNRLLGRKSYREMIIDEN